uniref:Peptidase S1 domain-containing protein n=1 Tax=Leptobrachium leishanense TaxID=445787 RepID=A0A8C5M1Y0_9ANUR
MLLLLFYRPGSVIVQFVLLFNTTNEETTKLLTTDSVFQIFLENFGTSSWSSFRIDTNSFNISAISISDAENLLHTGLISSTSSSNIWTTTVSPNSASVSSTIITLQDFTGSPGVCGASSVLLNFLVHARRYKDVTLWTVILGTITLSNGKGLDVKEIIINENYITSDYVYDIALLRLLTPIQFTKHIRPVCLPEKSTFFPDNTTCYVTGWGSTVSGGSPSVTLQQAHVKIINYGLCSSAAMYGSLIRPSMICAGYVEGGIDSCQGDSGGPLVTTLFNGTWYLVGSVSYGIGCALPNKPGVYSRTTYLRSWITEKTGL